MKYIFDEVGSLDRRCYEKFLLTEDILMEHAASGIAKYIEENFQENSSIVIVCGTGNNGADGIALGRLLFKKYDVKVYTPFGVKSNMAKLQFERIKTLGVQEVENIENCDLVVDCLFGSGLNKPLDEKAISIIKKMNSLNSKKIACDIPSGIDFEGKVTSLAFEADVTITMGAYKTSLFSDSAKDYVGEVIVANLGVQREVYETTSNMYFLEKVDLKLPLRNSKNTHKGTFGHVAVIVGEKEGASIIACDAAFSFGAGLVTAVSHLKIDLPANIMQSHFIPQNTTSIAIGMGLGNYEYKEVKEILSSNIPKIVDADLFYEKIVLEALNTKTVLTPHPKEFCSLLKLSGIANIEIEELQANRFKYVKEFMKKYPNVVLLLKGANVIIAHEDKIYVNTFGTPSLSKGGSGDVLSGLIASLLAQGYSLLDSAINASLAHSISAQNFSKNNYALKPQDIIESIKTI